MKEQEAERVMRALTFTIVRREKIPKGKIKMILEALGKGIDALEKQIEKKPVKRSFIVPYEGINVCPSCKEPLGGKEHHCRCGQKLDWGNEDAV